MKITVSQLRKIIKEEIEAVSEGIHDRVMIIPPLKKPAVASSAEVGKKRLPLDFSIDDLLASMTPEQKEELLKHLQK